MDDERLQLLNPENIKLIRERPPITLFMRSDFTMLHTNEQNFVLRINYVEGWGRGRERPKTNYLIGGRSLIIFGNLGTILQ